MSTDEIEPLEIPRNDTHGCHPSESGDYHHSFLCKPTENTDLLIVTVPHRHYILEEFDGEELLGLLEKKSR